MNVIAILDQTSPRRAAQRHGFDLRALLPPVNAADAGESWDEFWRGQDSPPLTAGKAHSGER